MRTLIAGAVLALLMSATARAEPSSPAVWGAVVGPAHGSAESIGGYSAGCLRGGVSLPLVGAGFRVARPERHRVWGHPSLIGFLRKLGTAIKTHRLPLLFIGDMAQPRGGPAPTGHASHQTGLDVDLAYAPFEGHSPPSMLDGKQPSKRFDQKVRELLQLAASDPRVERIFVNPILKRALCETVRDRTWLHKLRPWWGHSDHFHVRLRCPDGDSTCVSQSPLPPGDGCAELAWWFDTKAQQDRKKSRDTYQSKVGAGPDLPDKCREVLDDK